MTMRKTADGYTIQGFKMKLLPGFAAEYERRHDELWPEMVAMLHDYGARSYSIFLDPETDTLFASVEVADPAHYGTSAETENANDGGITWPMSWRSIPTIHR